MARRGPILHFTSAQTHEVIMNNATQAIPAYPCGQRGQLGERALGGLAGIGIPTTEPMPPQERPILQSVSAIKHLVDDLHCSFSRLENVLEPVVSSPPPQRPAVPAKEELAEMSPIERRLLEIRQMLEGLGCRMEELISRGRS